MTIIYLSPSHKNSAENLQSSSREAAHLMTDSSKPFSVYFDNEMTLIGHSGDDGATIEHKTPRELAALIKKKLPAGKREQMRKIYLVSCEAGVGVPASRSFAAKLTNELIAQGFNEEICVYAAVPPTGAQNVTVNVAGLAGVMRSDPGEVSFLCEVGGEQLTFARVGERYKQTFQQSCFEFRKNTSPTPMSINIARVVEAIDSAYIRKFYRTSSNMANISTIHKFLDDQKQQLMQMRDLTEQQKAQMIMALRPFYDETNKLNLLRMSPYDLLLFISAQSSNTQEILNGTFSSAISEPDEKQSIQLDVKTTEIISIIDEALRKNGGSKYSEQKSTAFLEEQQRILKQNPIDNLSQEQFEALKKIFTNFKEDAFLRELHGRWANFQKGPNEIDDIFTTLRSCISLVFCSKYLGLDLPFFEDKSSSEAEGNGAFFYKYFKRPLQKGALNEEELKRALREVLDGAVALLSGTTALEEQKREALGVVRAAIVEGQFWRGFSERNTQKKGDIVYCISQAINQILESNNIQETLLSLNVKRSGASGNGKFFIKHIKKPLLERFNLLTEVSVNRVLDNANMRKVVKRIDEILVAIQNSEGAVEEKGAESEEEGLLSNNSDSLTSVTELLNQIKCDLKATIKEQLSYDKKDKIIEVLDILAKERQTISGKPVEERQDILTQIKIAIDAIRNSSDVDKCILNLETTSEKLVQPIKPSDGFWTKLNKSSSLASTLHRGDYFRETFKLELLKDNPEKKLIEALKHYQRKRSSQYIWNVVSHTVFLLGIRNLFFWAFPSKQMETKLSAAGKVISYLNDRENSPLDLSDIEKKALRNGTLGSIIDSNTGIKNELGLTDNSSHLKND